MGYITAHPLIVIGCYMLFSALVSGMPEPTPNSSIGYLWAYRSLHTLAFNIGTAVRSKIPELPAGTIQQTNISQTTVTGEKQ
jgi:hypothetical protein